MKLSMLIHNKIFQKVNSLLSMILNVLFAFLGADKLIRFLNFHLLHCYDTKGVGITGPFLDNYYECFQGMPAPKIESLFTYLGFIFVALACGYWGSFLLEINENDKHRIINQKTTKELFFSINNLVGSISVGGAIHAIILFIIYTPIIFHSQSTLRARTFSIIIIIINTIILSSIVKLSTKRY